MDFSRILNTLDNPKSLSKKTQDNLSNPKNTKISCRIFHSLSPLYQNDLKTILMSSKYEMLINKNQGCIEHVTN
jgi:hypothetical protein